MEKDIIEKMEIISTLTAQHDELVKVIGNITKVIKDEKVIINEPDVIKMLDDLDKRVEFGLWTPDSVRKKKIGLK